MSSTVTRCASKTFCAADDLLLADLQFWDRYTVCDLDYDPFRYMQDHDKRYGWTVSLYEYESTIPTLWEKTKGAPRRAPPVLSCRRSRLICSC